MQDESFVYFTQDDILSKIDIDPRLVDSFKRVMAKLQDYFNANGYTSQRNYKEYIEKYLLNSDDKNMRFYINKLEKEGIGGFFAGGVKFGGKRNEICINESILKQSPELLDSTLCHEFIHFLVMHGLEVGKAEPDIIYGGFINESLTEMLTQQMYPNSKAYDAQVAMQKYANLISGKSNNYSRFLQGYIDARYASPDWEQYRNSTNAFQSDFNKEGYINLLESQSNSNFIKAQRSLISLFIRPNGKKNINEYIDSINKLLERPVADTEYINNVIVAAMDKNLISNLGLNDKNLTEFLEKKLGELRDTLSEVYNNRGKRTFKFDFEGRKIIIDEDLKVSGDIMGVSRQYNPQTGEMIFTLNGKKMSLNTNDIDFNNTFNKIESLSNYFKKESSQDLSMISQASKQTGTLTKIEKFTLPNIDGKNTQVYVATYEDKIVILGNSTQIGNIENIQQSRYIGVTSKNPAIAAINYESLGVIDKGLLFSTLTSKQIRNKAIFEYCKQLESKLTQDEVAKAIENYKKSPDFIEDSEEEIRYEAISRIAKSNFDKLSEQEKNQIISNVYKQSPRFVLSTENGKLNLSIMYGDKNSFKGKSETLYDSKGLGMYNEVLENISKNVVEDVPSEKSSISIDTNGNIVYPNIIKESDVMNNNPQEELINLNRQMSNLRQQYGTISSQIENLMKQNQQTPIANYQQQLNDLIKKRDLISEQMELTSSSQKTYQNIIQMEKENDLSNRISQVEKLLGIRITDTSMYEYDSTVNAPRVVLKDTDTLSKERGSINQKLEELYYDGQLDSKTYISMKLAVYSIYEKMSKTAPKPTQSSARDESTFTQQQEQTQTPIQPSQVNTYTKEQTQEDKFREKYGYYDMSPEGRERFNRKFTSQTDKKKQTDPTDKSKLEEQRRDLRRKQFEERAKAMGIDTSKVANLDEIFRQQQMIEQQRLMQEQEQIEEIEHHGMSM